jgi:hypothetical protein
LLSEPLSVQDSLSEQSDSLSSQFFPGRPPLKSLVIVEWSSSWTLNS